jgi:hypothetical protein
MSTKIYNGGVLMPTMSMTELLDWCRKTRSILCKARTRAIKELYDEQSYRKSFHELQMRAWAIKKSGRRDPLVDFSFEASFFPVEDTILVMPFQDNPTMLEAWWELEGIRKFGYWDNTDPDDSCSESEWDTRKRLWSKALPGAGIPSENSFSFTFTGYDLPLPSKVFK